MADALALARRTEARIDDDLARRFTLVRARALIRSGRTKEGVSIAAAVFDELENAKLSNEAASASDLARRGGSSRAGQHERPASKHARAALPYFESRHVAEASWRGTHARRRTRRRIVRMPPRIRPPRPRPSLGCRQRGPRPTGRAAACTRPVRSDHSHAVCAFECSLRRAVLADAVIFDDGRLHQNQAAQTKSWTTCWTTPRTSHGVPSRHLRISGVSTKLVRPAPPTGAGTFPIAMVLNAHVQDLRVRITGSRDASSTRPRAARQPTARLP